MAQNVTDDNFEAEVLQAQGPVLVDFWAEWCGPCKALAPLVDDLSEEMADKIKVVKVNIDESPTTPTTYGVRGIPTLMVFQDGQVKETKVGGMGKPELTSWVESAI